MDPVADQLEAQNDRDIEGFLSCCHPGLKIEEGEGNISMHGHQGIKVQHIPLFDSSPDLHSRLVSGIQPISTTEGQVFPRPTLIA